MWPGAISSGKSSNPIKMIFGLTDYWAPKWNCLSLGNFGKPVTLEQVWGKTKSVRNAITFPIFVFLSLWTSETWPERLNMVEPVLNSSDLSEIEQVEQFSRKTVIGKFSCVLLCQYYLQYVMICMTKVKRWWSVCLDGSSFRLREIEDRSCAQSHPENNEEQIFLTFLTPF